MFAKFKSLCIRALTISDHLNQVFGQALPHTMGAIKKEITETNGDSDGYRYGLLLVLGSASALASAAPCWREIEACNYFMPAFDCQLLKFSSVSHSSCASFKRLMKYSKPNLGLKLVVWQCLHAARNAMNGALPILQNCVAA